MSYADGLLTSDEEIIRREHQHWIFPFYIAGKWVLIAVIVTVIGFLLSQFVFRGGGTGFLANLMGVINQVVWIITVVALLIAVVGFVYSIIQWQTQEYILTDHRVLHVHGVINKQSGDSSLENVTDAQINIPWLGRILGFGDLVVMTASEAGINQLRALTDPVEFKKAMMTAKTDRMVLLNTPRMAAAIGTAPAAPFATPAASEPAPVPAAPAPAPEATADEITRTLASLAALRDSGAITAEEYEAKKTELLDRI